MSNHNAEENVRNTREEAQEERKGTFRNTMSFTPVSRGQKKSEPVAAEEQQRQEQTAREETSAGMQEETSADVPVIKEEDSELDETVINVAPEKPDEESTKPSEQPEKEETKAAKSEKEEKPHPAQPGKEEKTKTAAKSAKEEKKAQKPQNGGKAASDKKTQSSKKKKSPVFRHIKATFITVVLLAFAGIIGLCVIGGDKLVTTPVGSLFAPVENAINSGLVTLRNTFAAFDEKVALVEKVNSLEQELALANVKSARNEELANENERLNALMGNYEKYGSYTPVLARVTGRETNSWFSVFTINKGSLNGLDEKMVVMNADGVVGRISKVFPNSAIVTAIIDGSSAVSVLIERNRDNGIARGMIDETDGAKLLQINYLPDIGDVRTGDIVVTSGLDGIFPKGLPIGTVTQISRQSSGTNQYALVEPYCDFLHIEEVIVLKTTD